MGLGAIGLLKRSCIGDESRNSRLVTTRARKNEYCEATRWMAGMTGEIEGSY